MWHIFPAAQKISFQSIQKSTSDGQMYFLTENTLLRILSGMIIPLINGYNDLPRAERGLQVVGG